MKIKSKIKTEKSSKSKSNRKRELKGLEKVKRANEGNKDKYNQNEKWC